MIRFFDIHVFHGRNDGFGVPIKIDDSITDTDEDSIINFAVSIDKIDSEDANCVDYVDEIDEEDFLNMGGKL